MKIAYAGREIAGQRLSGRQNHVRVIVSCRACNVKMSKCGLRRAWRAARDIESIKRRHRGIKLMK